MCLGVPGRVVDVWEDERGTTMGRVSFDGVVKEVCLAYTPDARPADYVIVHVGFAITRVDEAEAARLLEDLTAVARPETGGNGEEADSAARRARGDGKRTEKHPGA